MTEKQLEQKLIKAVKENGGLCLKFTSPGTAGVPDRIIILPNGHVGFVEVKKPGAGRLSKQQAYWLDTLRKDYQIPTFVLDDPEQIAEILEEIGTEKVLRLEMTPEFYLSFLEELRGMINNPSITNFIHTILFNTMTGESMIEFLRVNGERLEREKAGDPMDLRLFTFRDEE